MGRALDSSGPGAAGQPRLAAGRGCVADAVASRFQIPRLWTRRTVHERFLTNVVHRAASFPPPLGSCHPCLVRVYPMIYSLSNGKSSVMDRNVFVEHI